MHILCPHCRNPIEVVKLTPHADILCPLCGSTFRLEMESTTALKRDAGQKLDRFEILDSVGHGAFGTVYKARDPKLDRTVAIKVPRAGHLAGTEELDRFLREARSVAQLRHPSIVTVHEVGQAEDVPFLVSDYVEGVTLAELIAARRMSLRDAAILAAAVAEALHYAHDNGVVHRDVKPSNIMIGPEGKPCIMDFGLAKRDAGEVTMTVEGQVLGTPAYMSPEQARGEGHRVDGRSDVYSLGVILYELLAGELPFRGSSRMLLLQVLNDEPRPPRSFNDRIPRDLETITLKAMAKEPARRYATAQALADDLRRFLAGEPIMARPVGRLERVRRWAQRRPAVAGLLATLGLVLAISLPALTILWLQAESAKKDFESQRDAANMAQADATQGWNTANQRLDEVTAAKREAEMGRESARHHLYGARASLMLMAWRNQALGRVGELLEQQKPAGEDADLRGFEWHYFRQLLEGSQVTLAGHTDAVSVVAFSPDRRYLASGSKDGTAKVWELATRLEVRTFPDHKGGVVGVTLGPDSRRLATVDGEGTVRVWETATGKVLFSLRNRTAGPGAVSFNPDGLLLAVAGQEQAALHDETGKEVSSFAGPGKGVTAVTFSADGKHIASAGGDGMVRLWEASSGKERHSVRIAPRITQLAFMADDRRVILTAANGGIAVWHPETGQGGGAFPGYGENAFPATLSRDGRQVAHLAPADVVRVVDTSSGRELFALRKHAGPITCIAYSADGSRIATASQDRTVKVWSSAFDLEVQELPGHVGEVFAVTFSPDGEHLATAGADGTLRVREAATGQEVLLLQAHASIHRNAQAPDQMHKLQGTSALAFRRDGQRLASGGADGMVKVWDTKTGHLLRGIRAHGNAVSGVAFSPDGRLLASSSWDKTVKVWEAETGQLLHTLSGHTREATRIAFRPDGELLASCSWDQTIRLWNPATGLEVRRLNWVSKPGQVDPLDSLAFHPDGKLLAAAPDPYGGGGEVKVFDLETGTAVHSLGGHIYGIFQVTFSGDGRRLASCSCDGGLKVWDTATGQELFTFDNRSGRPPGADGPIDSRRDALHSVALNQDGQRLALGCRNSKVLVLDATPPTPELLVQREAVRRVAGLYDQLVTPAAVLEHLRGDSCLSDALRREAVIRSERWLRDPGQLNDASWVVVAKQGGDEAAYRQAHLQAQEADRLQPENGTFLNTLGVAQYRVGDYQAAVATLTRSDKLHSAANKGSDPADLAFLAMAQHQLGQKDAARATLERLQKAMKSPPTAEDKGFLREAELLILQKPSN